MKPLIDELEKAEKHEQFLSDKSNFPTARKPEYKSYGFLRRKETTSELIKQIYDKHTVCVEGDREYFGLFGPTEKEWYDEYRFNEKKHAAAVSGAREQVKNCEQKVESKLKSKEEELNNVYSETYATKREIEKLHSEIKNNSTKHQKVCEENARLAEDIADKQQQIPHMNLELTNLNSQINSINASNRVQETQIQNAQKNLDMLSQKLDGVQVKILEQVMEASEEKRAFFISELFEQSGTEFMVNAIKNQGYDADFLGYLAMNKNDQKLFNFALQDMRLNVLIDGRTLLEHAILTKQNSYINKLLNSGLQLNVSLLNAIKNDDLATINTVVKHSPEILHHKHAGYTVFHVAVATGKFEIAKSFIDIDQSVLNDFTSKGESISAIALRSESDATIQLLKQYKVFDEAFDGSIGKDMDLNDFAAQDNELQVLGEGNNN